MVQLTSNFTSEAPLAPPVREAISIALQDGWADPKKSSQSSAQSAALRQSCLEEIASHCGVSPAHLEIVGEPNLAYFLAISGLLTPAMTLITSSVDQGKIRAVARSHSGGTFELQVDCEGRYRNMAEMPKAPALLVMQSCNGETGTKQDSQAVRSALTAEQSLLIDASHDLPSPDLLLGSSGAIFDSAAWNGPTGIGIIYIADPAKYRYPLPHIAPIRSPGSYSLSLLVGATVALTLFQESRLKIDQLRTYAVTQLSAVSGITILGERSIPGSRYLSFLVPQISSEELLRLLQPLGINLDAGSACSPEDLTPSHVIAALGFATAGHMRMTIHPESSAAEIDYVVASIKRILEDLSR